MLLVISLHLALLPFMVAHAGAHNSGAGCPASKRVSLSIGGIVDRGSRMGREQEVAMKMAVEEVNEDCLNHYKLQLHLVDSNGSSARAISGAMKLIDGVKVESLLGRLHFQQAAMITDINEKSKQIPLILLNPTAVTPPLVQLPSQNLIQMSDDISLHAQCIAAIVGYFRWSKVSVIYEQDGAFALNSGMITTLSDALESVDATIEKYRALQPHASSGWDPSTIFISAEESLKKNLSKLVLAPWLFLILMLTANFTAALTSKLTVAQLQPSASDIETLRRDNANIGCNRRSFTCHYLVDVLHIKRKNVREIRSIDDYPGAFQRGEIKAAVFVTEHANVFLAIYCRGFTLAGPTFTFGGLGFAFQKGSPLTADVSRAILRVIESGELGNMEKVMLSHYNCSSADDTKDTSELGFRPFSGLFYISGGMATTALLVFLLYFPNQPIEVHKETFPANRNADSFSSLLTIPWLSNPMQM